MPKKVLFVLNEKIAEKDTKKKFVVVPINYREYDRQMSRAYGQPLKKQCWRLFQQGSGQAVDIVSEIIPIDGVTLDENSYRLRFVRRPQPIVLADFNFENQEALDIDGVSVRTECELNPVLHNEILNKAVELAITTRGGRAVPTSQQR